MIIVENEFAIGEEVYSIINKQMEIKCSLCEGKGQFEHNTHNVRCPQCKGTGKITSNYKSWEVIDEKLTVGSIKANIGSNNITLRYGLHSKLTRLRRGSQNVFKTYEEAQNKCDELNYVIVEGDNNE